MTHHYEDVFHSASYGETEHKEYLRKEIKRAGIEKELRQQIKSELLAVVDGCQIHVGNFIDKEELTRKIKGM